MAEQTEKEVTLEDGTKVNVKVETIILPSGVDVLLPISATKKIYKIWQFWFWTIMAFIIGLSISWLSFGLWCWRHTLDFRGVNL